MTRFLLFAFGILAFALQSLAVGKAIPPLNLLQNPSFETDVLTESWSVGSEQLYNLDQSTAHRGGKSLAWQNDDPEQYSTVTQSVALTPGRSYELSAFIRTENLRGVRESGATIALGYYDADGKYVRGGPHPGGQKGTGDWWQLVSYTGPIPEEITRGSFTIYVRKNERQKKTFTGKAWWDDVALRPVSLEMRLLQPAYKRRVTDEAPTLALETVAWPEDFGLEWDDVRVRVRVINGEQNTDVVFEHIYPLGPQRRATIAVDISHLNPAKYDVLVDLLHAQTGQVLWHHSREIHRVSESNDQLAVHIDEYNRLIVDGKPFFPIGIYVRKAPIDLLTNTPFNCFMSYDALSKSDMDAAHTAGLKVIYSVKDYYNRIWYSPEFIRSIHDEVPSIRSTAKKFRNHPALLAWYVNDERGPECLVEHHAHYEALNNEDPDHPAWSLHHTPREITDLMDTCDIAGVDTYPVPKDPIAKVAQDTQKTFEAVRNQRPAWVVPQIFNWAVHLEEGRPPMLAEMRSMAWQAICNGANGLIFYSLHSVQRDPKFPFDEQWDAIKTMAGEVAEFSPALLSEHAVPPTQLSQHDWLHWTARVKDDTLYIFAVSDASGAGPVQFTVDDDVVSVKRQVLAADRTLSENITNVNKWTDRFNEGDVRIYQIKIAN